MFQSFCVSHSLQPCTLNEPRALRTVLNEQKESKDKSIQLDQSENQLDGICYKIISPTIIYDVQRFVLYWVFFGLFWKVVKILVFDSYEEKQHRGHYLTL